MEYIKYFQVETIEQAEQLSALMLKLSYPNGCDISSTHLFGWREIGEIPCIEIPTGFEFHVYIKPEFIEQLKIVLNGFLTETEGGRIMDILKTGKAKLIEIIPNTLVEVEPVKNNINPTSV